MTDRCPHKQALTDAAERLVRAVARDADRLVVMVAARRWVEEHKRCTGRCERCPERMKGEKS